jgi:hypothetical protein
MGGAGAAFPVLMAGNCIVVGDVMTRYLADPKWHPLRISCIEAWPAGWADKGPAWKLWAEWWDAYRHDAKAGARFYRARRAAMTAGMKLSSPHAYADKADATLPDARCVAMRQYWQMGHEAFMAERQQTPLDPDQSAHIAVTPELILSRATDRALGAVPADAVKIVAAADVNPGGTSQLGARLSWAVVAFARNQVAHVTAWGIHPVKVKAGASKAEEGGAVYQALNELRQKVQSMGAESLVYDARGWASREISLKYGMTPNPQTSVPAVPAEGWSAKHYRPSHKTALRAFENAHEAADRVGGVRVRWIAWHSDAWHESSLGGWACAPGAPGSCDLPAGNHRQFAEQCASISLAWKADTPTGLRWEWREKPGEHDFADGMAMAYMAAAWQGVGTGGVTSLPQSRKSYSQSDLRRG